ncbi:MAG: hypothetical protein J0I32_05910 [Sphingobacteriales bacterium]|nr:hypothetical protein [Sphingobacteriales bacterium]OJW03896.1 MAG: hypothetical protein BGO52_17250 [Sphingobacteriales bacterium 44-61]
MISLRLKSSLAIALICFVLGCCTAFLLTTNCSSPSKSPALTHAALLKQQADSLHAHYHASITALEARNKQLTTELQSTKAELKAAKSKTNTKAAAIKKIINPPGYPAKELIKKSSASPVSENPTLQNCDSLKILVGEFLEETEQKDSIYEAYTLQQDSLITGKDEVIVLQENENRNLSFLFKQSLSQQTILEKDNLSLHKKIKRQRSAGRWLAVGSAIITGLATHYLSNR